MLFASKCLGMSCFSGERDCFSKNKDLISTWKQTNLCNDITSPILPVIFTFVSHKLTPKASRFCSGRGQSSLWESRVAVDKTEGELKFPRKEQLRRLLWELRSVPAVYLSWVSPSALFSSLSIGPFPFSNLSLDLTTTQGFISIHQLPGGVSLLVSQRHFKTKLICFSFSFFPSVCVWFIFSAWYLVTHFNLNILFFFFSSWMMFCFCFFNYYCFPSSLPVLSFWHSCWMDVWSPGTLHCFS